MGSVYRKLKGGRDLGWYAAYVDLDGRRRHIATKQPTKQAARVFLAEIEAKVRRGLVGVPENRRAPAPTVGELAERWLAELSGPKAEGRRATGRTCLRRLLPDLGKVQAPSLTRAQVRAQVAALARRYAPNTVRSTLDTLGAVLGAAVRDGILQDNVARAVPLPRREVAVEWLSREQAAALLDLAERRGERSLPGGARYVAVALALLCGLRRGEVFGLRWHDVDLVERRLTVSRSFDGATKNGRPRHLPLPDELVPILTAWRGRCPKTADGLVCPSPRGAAWGMSSGKADGLVTLLTAAGCRLRRPWHGLRHSFASLFVMSGGDLYTLAQLLGHSDVRQTQAYAHLAPQFLAAERSRLRIRS